MKTLILTVMITLLMSTTAAFAAERSIVYGSGSAYGMCNGLNYNTCVLRIKRDAEYQAENDMRSSCSLRGGRLVSYPSCGFTSCNPNWMPPEQVDQMVSCRADCNAYCEQN